MAITLLVENNHRIERFYHLNLTTWLGLEVVTQDKAESAVRFLEESGDQVNLIIVRAQLDHESTAKILNEYLKKKGSNKPIIVIGPGKGHDVEVHVANSLDLKLLIKTAATSLGITAKEMMGKPVPDFYPIATHYLSVLKHPVSNVFANKDGKYELVFKKNQPIDPKLIKGHEYIYIDKMDRLEFVSDITSVLMSELAPGDISPDEQVTATDRSIELLSKKLLTVGVTEDTINLAKKTMEQIKKNVKSSPNLSKLVDRLLSNQASYLFLHTQILTYVALHIVHNIDWGNPEQEEKISFICFFHDIVLENDEQAKIKSTTELKLSSLTPEKKQLVEKHAQLAGELAAQFPRAPMGADQIIKQHHGQLNGLGFSEHFGANVSPISVVFIVAEEFTRIILKQEPGKLNRTEMLKELKTEFPTSRFNKVLELLKTITF